MEMLEHFKKRRSIRKFLSKPMEDEKIKKLIEAAIFSPSSKNSQPLKFFVVKNKELIEELSKARGHANFLKNAPLAIVVTVDETLSTEHFIEDASIAAFAILLEASDLGLGACWSAIYFPDNQAREDYVRDILRIPKKCRVICNIGIGYPDEKPEKKIVKKFEDITKII